MKKAIAIILALVVVFAVTVPVFAVDSPSGDVTTTYDVKCYGVKGVSDGTVANVKKGETFTLVADDTKGEFTGWSITGKYSVVSGSLTEKTVVIKPESDVFAAANFKGSANPADILSRDTNHNGKYDIKVVGGNGVTRPGTKGGVWTKNAASITYDEEKNEFDIEAFDDKGTFDNWSIYLITYDKDGKKQYVEATEGLHYDLIVNDPNITDEQIKANLLTLLREKKITIAPYADIVICGNYNGKVTSPKTFDYSVYFVVLALFSVAGLAFAGKKILSK